MVFNKILVPTDGSEYTKAAIIKALEVAEMCKAEVTALYVVDQTIFTNVPMDTAVMNVYRTLKKEGESALSYVEEQGKERGVDVKVRLEEGVPVKTILELSKEYDLIIMGTLGRTGMSKFLMGSVAEKVVRASHCPVMVVRSVEADKQ
ncbi:MAG: universal stress protein [Candidatus Methanomethylophilaceae archaeon]|jgi:nucleotide-binding universal stress UspA family protein